MNEQESGSTMEKKCPQCGASLPSGGLAGLCPACLLAQAANETAVPPGTAGFVPPTVAELAALFPQLEILSLIGKGGMGAVYQARQPALDRIVALKVLPARTDTGMDFAERFNREARALARLNHPNIVTVYEFGQVNGLPFFIMEYVDGLNLRQLEQAGNLSPREALQIVPQICEALQFAHDAGIVHRDIKPDNILLDKKGRVKIADFGIAKIMGAPAETGVSETQGAIGTPNYMAPEQIEKPQTVDHRADIFSLGVVFYEMLTGELPLGKFAPPSSGPRGLRVDVRLDDVVLRALEKEPDRRYQHASQVKTALETIAGTPPGGPPDAPQPPPPTPGPTPESILARDYILNIGSCVDHGWALMKAHFWELLGIHALFTLLIIIADSVFARLSTIGDRLSGGMVSDGTSFVGLLLTGPLLAGLFLYFLKTMRGEPATVETAFMGFGKRFLHLFLVHLVSWFLIILGFFCFILPGVYLLVSWCFALVLVMDKGLEFWPAMELSRRMVHKHWWKVFGLLLVIAGVWLLGLCGCCVGILVSAPVAMAVFLYAYEAIFLGEIFRTPVGPALASSPFVGAVAPGRATTPASPNPSTPPAASGPAHPPGPVGPFGTKVIPGSPVEPPKAPAGVPTVFKVMMGASAGFLVIVALAFLYRIAEIHRLDGWEMLLIMAVFAFFFVIVLLAAGLLVAVTGGGSRILKYALGSGAVAALLLFVAVLGAFQHKHRMMTRTFRVNVASAPQPIQPLAPPAPNQPGPPSAAALAAYDRLSARTAQELGKYSVHFDKLLPSSTNGNTLLLSFSGLQEMRLADGSNIWQDISGSLSGSRINREKWVFEGQEALSVVRFDVAGLDVSQVLAAADSFANPSPAEYSHDKMAERLDLAKNITEITVKDKALDSVAREAAAAGDLDIAKSAIDEMVEVNAQGLTTHDIAILLAKTGHRKEAIEIAEGITSISIHDQTLAELAQ